MAFDFTGATITRADFGQAQFTGGDFRFARATFCGKVNFAGARFSFGKVDFHEAEFRNGTVDFSGAAFSGGTVNFSRAVFSGGTVNFTGATPSSGTIDFSGAKFAGSLFVGADGQPCKTSPPISIQRLTGTEGLGGA